MNNSLKKSKKLNINALVFCVCGICLNLALNSLAVAFELPVYLDTVGTVIISCMGGFLPGVIVGFFTNIFKSITDPSSLYYGVLNVLIAVVGSGFAKKGLHRSLKGALMMTVSFTLIGGGLGSLIPLFMDDLALDSQSLSGILYSTGYFNAVVAHILSSVLYDFPDKVITMLIAFVTIRLIPEKLYDSFRLTAWKQRPLPREVSEQSEKSRISLRIKALILLAVSMTAVAVTGIGICMTVYHKDIVRDRSNLAQSIARIAAAEINGNKIDIFLRTGGNDPDYISTKQRLTEILNDSHDIAYLYVYRAQSDGSIVVFDIDTETTPADSIGSLKEYDDAYSNFAADLIAGRPVEPVLTTDKYGYLLTAFEPVYDSKGNCTCYAIADVDMEQLTNNEKSFLVELITVFLSFFITIGVVGIWLAQYHIIYPVRSITEFADDFSDERMSQKDIDGLVKRLRKLDIHTGDETEQLYHALCRMTLGQAEQTRSIMRLSDVTAKMQDGLIITMADLVESRDSDTGAHIQKTAAYVKIIVEGLKRKGYYAEKITPKFMSDVVRSAPLHDIGKINIPDSVLNKPGKLTDEEYDIIKTHTTAGKQIIERAIGKVEGDSYLKEARNMAAYHHERWDGKGYPEGLHGNVIPLSARIMAVADVFDALASPRVYKPAFPLEKALAIIEEGKGTQFDPKCVEVFMEAVPEVKEVLNRFQNDTNV